MRPFLLVDQVSLKMKIHDPKEKVIDQHTDHFIT